jgi:hypothetical protein
VRRTEWTISDITGLEGQKKLDEYNKWLLDPKREFGVPRIEKKKKQPKPKPME